MPDAGDTKIAMEEKLKYWKYISISGELIGIEYLNTQSSDYSKALNEMQMDPHLGENDVEDDSGISNIIEVPDLTMPTLVIAAQTSKRVTSTIKPILSLPTDEENKQLMVESTPGKNSFTTVFWFFFIVLGLLLLLFSWV